MELGSRDACLGNAQASFMPATTSHFATDYRYTFRTFKGLGLYIEQYAT